MLMISTSPITEHSATSTNGPRGMTYDPYLGPSGGGGGGGDGGASRGAKVPEFLRPLPKPARYNNNGETCTPLLATTYPTPPVRINGIRPNNNQQITRIQQQPNQQTKYLPPRPILEEAVNLVHKREYNGVQEDYSSQQQRLYVPPSNSSTSAYTVSQSLPPPPPHSISSQQNTTQYNPNVSHYYTQPNSSVTAPIVTHQYTTGPLYFNNSIQQQQQQTRNSQQQQYSLSTTTNVSNSTISPHHTYIQIPNTINNNNNIINNTSYSPPKPGQSILKETISKPVISTATTTTTTSSHQQLLQLQQHHHQQKLIPFKVPSGKEGSLKHRILTRPPGSGPNSDPPINKRKSHNGPLHPSGAHFARGSLIQLANGELRKIEDMRTEDFISAAEKCPALRLDPSTVVRILENSQRPQEVLITLSYGRQGTQQVELEVSLEHPFFVYGKGWASISPERTLHNFDLPCHRLGVGDICISLSPRPSQPPPPPVGTTKMAADRLAHHQATVAAAAAAEMLRKRRWSAPDHFLSDDENEGPTPSQRTKDTTTGF